MDGTPAGTVTFLFTDVEGSTRLWEERPEEMRAALAEHDATVRAAIDRHHGYVFATGGDGFAAAFARAGDALAAARAAQAGLADQAILRVRMGLHTGETIERDGDYFGPAVNRAARLMAAGEGGQVLVSGTTVAIVGSAGLVDLGEHRLRDVSEPTRIWQVGDHRHPPLRTSAARNVQLPGYRTSFVGRGELAASVRRRLATERVVTLVGVGGVGKTRLAVEVAGHVAHRFAAVWFVDLAVVGADDDVVPAALAALGIELQAGMQADRVAAGTIGDRVALLVVDNAEHVLAAVAELVDELLDRCPNLVVLTTSRERLGLAGEQVVHVPPLGAGGDGRAAAGDRWRMLAERALAVNADLDVGGPNGEALARIADELDGVPLALELAAARLGSLTPVQLADRLGERFRLLHGGRRARGRHQTLRAAVQWSYDLLEGEARALFDELSLWPAGFTLDLVASTCGRHELDVIGSLDELVAKSMLAFDPGTGRYRMLETLRQYGQERLAEAGRVGEVRGRTARALAAWVERRAAGFHGEHELANRDAVTGELANIVAMCDWCVAERDPTPAARVLAALAVEVQFGSNARLWDVAEPVGDLLDPDSPFRPPLCSITIWACAMRARREDAERRIAAAARARREHPDGPWYWLDWGVFTYLAVTGDVEEGRAALSRVARGAARRGNDQLAMLAEAAEPYLLSPQLREEEASDLGWRSVRRADEAGRAFVHAFACSALARALDRTDPGTAVRLAEEAITGARRVGAPYVVGLAERTVARAMVATGDVAATATHLLRSLDEHDSYRSVAMLTTAYTCVAQLLARLGRLDDAAIALGTSEASMLGNDLTVPMYSVALDDVRRAVDSGLAGDELARLVGVGRAMGTARAVAWTTEVLAELAATPSDGA